MTTTKYWLLKAEPDSRIVKGKDVKFSVDDFESIKTSPWEGVRNYEARNLMKDMKLGDKTLFYHSNCKTPGIAAFAEVSKEAYPDYTAWDASHPYYDAKTNKNNSKWFMVDLTFTSRATHFIPLALLRFLSECAELPTEIEYIKDTGLKAIKSMDLVTRGRLSVQRVDDKAWEAISMLAEKGGWEDMDLKPKKRKAESRPKQATRKLKTANSKRVARPKEKKESSEEGNHNEEERDDEDGEDSVPEVTATPTRGGRKRKAKAELDEEYRTSRRSTRPRAAKRPLPG